MADSTPQKSFAEAATDRPRGLGSELIEMLKYNKKWWIVPIVAVLLLFGALLMLGSTAAAPFIYTLF